MERKIKILFSVPRFSVGGAEKFLVNHLASIDRQKYDVTLITLFDEQEGSSGADKVTIDKCFYFSSTWDFRGFMALWRYFQKERFEVVVTHLFSANLLVRFVAILTFTPVVISYEHNIYPNKRYWQIIVDKIFSWWTDRIVVDSDAAKIFTARQERIPLSKFLTIIIPPLLDNKPRRSREEVLDSLGIPHDALAIVTVSRLVVDKGHKYLVAATPEVLSRHRNAYFLIGGWGPLQGDLEQQVKDLRVSGNVRILGRVDGQEFTAMADLYVDPSISTDLPIGIMEAMTRGKAIVATSVGEIPNFVVHEETGLIVPPADPSSLALSIARMLDNSGLRSQLGDAAKIKVAEYSMENYMRAFDEMVERCMAS